MKWYDLLGLFVPVYLTAMWVWVYFVAGANNWIVTLRMNDYGEGMIELIIISACFIWGVISFVGIMRWKLATK